MKYLLRSFAYMLLILIIVTFLTSLLLNLIPGDPAYAIIGDGATPAQIAALHAKLHLDQAAVPRYLDWLGHAVRGDLGDSATSDTPVRTLIGNAIPVTVELIVVGQIFALLYTGLTSIYSAYKPRRIVDTASSAVSFAMISIPNFVLAIFFILIFAVKLHWFPVAGFVPISQDFGQNIRSMILPSIAMGAASAGIYQRLLRSDMRATLAEDFIAMAEAKGQSPLRILLRHALRPSLFSLMTLAGLTMAETLGGSVVIETLFALPGVGQLLVNSINLRDYSTVQGIVVLVAVVYVFVNFLLSALYGLVDPRVRSAERVRS
jgi:peptide/nickel transport system permease protein